MHALIYMYVYIYRRAITRTAPRRRGRWSTPPQGIPAGASPRAEVAYGELMIWARFHRHGRIQYNPHRHPPPPPNHQTHIPAPHTPAPPRRNTPPRPSPYSPSSCSDPAARPACSLPRLAPPPRRSAPRRRGQCACLVVVGVDGGMDVLKGRTCSGHGGRDIYIYTNIDTHTYIFYMYVHVTRTAV